jgi:hypothetical protein
LDAYYLCGSTNKFYLGALDTLSYKLVCGYVIPFSIAEYACGRKCLSNVPAPRHSGSCAGMEGCQWFEEGSTLGRKDVKLYKALLVALGKPNGTT